ncbi:MAG: TnsA endonuclease N-terminal domain-containing protein [Tepidibacter sp.]|jgi:hypothetical protein|uniref:TnsA endonuclease N-terminal domain-containing protein n=1 Tax=Tepidibacter sp. TaxID=2529387 RepID=UPI0025E8AFF7|nr:TnsA endonuclease N-terminal domain-containing protein [Tepidibacter sp.]MCT4507734.1 TnsA endonuclease N-terminal domain-containing protein [Tepidibacter sp.]
MAKRKRSLTESKIEKLIKEGRGKGIGDEYQPWILVQDVPSLGRGTRLNGIKTNRQHEFLSDMERDYFYILEYSNNVVDIREQFPLLPLEETILIAKELGINHPTDPKTKEPIVMTTDFLVTLNENGKYIDVARTIKSQDDLMNKRTLDKFEIERRYWEKQDIDWGIATEKEIDKVLAQNISYIHSYYNIEEIDSLYELDINYIEDLVSEYTRRIIDSKYSIREISSEFDKDLFLEKGTGISLFKHLIIRKIIEIDLYKEFDINQKIEVNLLRKQLDGEWNIS